MGQRTKAKKKRTKILVGGIGASLIVLSIGLGVYQLSGGHLPARAVPSATRAFFTDDDGKSLFVDDINKVPPFDHNGKQAVRAQCFAVDGQKDHWVGYLERYTPEGKRAMEAIKHRPIQDQDPIELSRLNASTKEVKLPGAPESTWTSAASPKQYSAIVSVKSRDGKMDSIVPYLP